MSMKTKMKCCNILVSAEEVEILSVGSSGVGVAHVVGKGRGVLVSDMSED